MISSENILTLLEAVKKSDQDSIDQIIKKLIKEAEKKGYHQVAKRLREIYSEPYVTQVSKNSGFSSSSFSSFTHSSSGLYEMRRPKVNLNSVILSKKNEQIASEVIKSFRNREKLKDFDIQYENNIFVFGPPGTGKTLFAYSLAGQLEIPILHVYLDTLISSYLGETGKNLGKIFSEAAKQECVIFLDEFDAIGKMRDDNQDLGELKRVVVVLLQKIDEMSPNNILVAATNHDHLIDKAIRRRFNYEMHLDLLDLEGRKKLFDLYLKKFKKVDSGFLASITEGQSGSAIRHILNKVIKNWYLNDSKGNLVNMLVDDFSSNYFSDIELDTKNDIQMKTFSRMIDKLRRYNSKKYTYKTLENLSGIADSTIYSIMEKYDN